MTIKTLGTIPGLSAKPAIPSRNAINVSTRGILARRAIKVTRTEHTKVLAIFTVSGYLSVHLPPIRRPTKAPISNKISPGGTKKIELLGSMIVAAVNE
ncbi:hypothetical protein [Corynebacterium ulcerans]|uniref:hypothetical protein n=1 Tax=Corynebacterium ulcerans TaxID=65058 RepID=UPI0018D5E6F4|nr:hypothetical protein [Corynebacterium ulcerans]MBH5297133.1 hypothetical protein [Corynebacterium ulcerans]